MRPYTLLFKHRNRNQIKKGLLNFDLTIFIGKSKGFDTVLVVVDRPRKYDHFILVKHPYLGQSIAVIFV